MTTLTETVPKPAIARALAHALESEGGWVLISDAGDRPDLLALGAWGALAIDIDTGSASGADPVPLKRLNGKVAQLSADVPELEDLPLHRFVLRPRDDGRRGPFALTRSDIADLAWVRELPRADLLPEAWQPVRDRLTPAATFSLTGRSRLLDDGRHARSELRVTLDAEQASAALHDVRDVLLVRGPAGSGKSLILAARARWLAEKHPGWRIQMLCFNNALVPYLRSLVEGYPMVSVTTIGKFAAGNGHRLSFTDEASARRDLDRIRESIDLTVDALLIDEWQDFLPAWTEYALTTLFPGRGGAVVVADPQQSLYRDEVPLSGLNGHDVVTVELNRPYRSTKQVLQTVQALHPGFHINGWEQAPDGEPVELIWAESALEQARAVAQDLTWLAQDGRPWSDMGVLVTQKWMIRPTARALHEAGVPHETIGKGQASTFTLRSNRVKLMTVHAAKGLEFGVAALLGLEHLKDPSESATTEDDRQARTRTARVGLVGPTRASDTLILTYTKQNVFLGRLRSSDAPYRAWTWPDDYTRRD